MKEKSNPLGGMVDAMLAHDSRLAKKLPPKAHESKQPEVAPVQTVASVVKPQKMGEKVFCGARYTRGQIEKVDQIIFLTHKERGVRLTQSDIFKQALERLPAAALEPGEVAELLAASGRKQLNSQTV